MGHEDCLAMGSGIRLLERLVGPEADDGQAERIDGQLVVLHVLAEDIGNAGCPLLPLEFGMVRGIREHFLELDARRIGRLAQVVEDDVLHLDIDKRKRAVFGVIGDDIVLALLVDHCALHVAIEEIERVGLVALDGEAIAAEIKFRPAGEVILVLRLLRPVLEVAIVDRFGPAHVVDADDERLRVGKRLLAAEDKRGERQADHGEHQNRDLQVGVHHQRIAVLFEVSFRRAGDLGRWLL